MQLSNICFKKCVVKGNIKDTDAPGQKEQLIHLLGVDEITPNDLKLEAKEIACVNNCARSYVELKGFIHEQTLKDYSFIRDKNRTTVLNL